jgi:uncharacterized membrane protein YcjF (UPF0283 family)
VGDRWESEVLAYDYPLLGAFWTMFWLFLWIIWFFLLFKVISDIFRSHDLGGWGKAAWLVFVIILPFLGIFVYLIARGHSMARRDAEQAQAQQEALQAYVRQAASTAGTGTAEELAKTSKSEA